MSNLDTETLKNMATELAKSVKTQADLSELSGMLMKMTVEAALGAEMDEHLGYKKTRFLTLLTVATVTPTKQLKAIMVKLKLLSLVIGRAVLNRLLLKKGKHALLAWTHRFSRFMPKA